MIFTPRSSMTFISARSVFRQAVPGNTDRQPPAGSRQGFEDVYVVTLDGQIIGACESRGTRTHDGHFFPLLSFFSGRYRVSSFKSRSATNLFRCIMSIGSSTSPLLHTDSQGWLQTHAHTTGNGLSSLMSFKGLRQITRSDQCHVSLDAYMGGTGGLTRRRAPFVDGESAGDRLRKVTIYCLPFRQSFVEVRRDVYRTYLRTVAAPVHLSRSTYRGARVIFTRK